VQRVALEKKKPGADCAAPGLAPNRERSSHNSQASHITIASSHGKQLTYRKMRCDQEEAAQHLAALFWETGSPVTRYCEQLPVRAARGTGFRTMGDPVPGTLRRASRQRVPAARRTGLRTGVT